VLNFLWKFLFISGNIVYNDKTGRKVKEMKIRLKDPLPDEIIFIIHTKAHELKNEGIQRIDADDIKSYLYNVKWKDRVTVEYCDVINDIMSLNFSELFDFLRAKVIVDARKKEITDFNDLIFK
jgi:hypothetical protein